MSSTSPTLIRPVFLNPRDGLERQGYRTHLKNSAGKPACNTANRSFGVGEGVAVTRWIEAGGETEPSCPICARIAKRGGKSA